MSMTALLLGCRDHVRKELSLSAGFCEVCFDGRPMPWVGETFYAVHPGSWRQVSELATNLDEWLGCQITITKRLGGAVPWDKAGPKLLAETSTGLLRAAEALRLKVHMNYDLMALVNGYVAQLADKGPVNGFEVPPRLTDISVPAPRGPAWFHARGKAEAGLSVTMTLSDGNRLQAPISDFVS